MLLTGLLCRDASTQSIKDTTNGLNFTVSILSFAGRYPSLQGGMYYRLSPKTGIDLEGSYLLPNRQTSENINNNIGFQLKAGYLISLLNPDNYWVVRMYCRNTNAYGREEFSRFQGAYIEQIDFRTSRTLAGLTLGWLRHTHHDICDFQIGFSAGYGALMTRGNLPQDAEILSRGFWSENIAQRGGFQPIFYVDLKMLF